MSKQSQEYRLTKKAWYGDEECVLRFPHEWNVVLYGTNLPALTLDELKKRIDQPINSVPLRTLVRRKKNVCILIDDLTRPTPAEIILPVILDELQSGGITREKITVVVAGGSHKALSNEEICKKVGTEVASTVKVISHDPYRNLSSLGISSLGVPIMVNTDVLNADLTVGIGCVYPHPIAGFSGGSKLVVPGVCGMTTMRCLHDHVKGAEKRGGSTATPFRNTINEIAVKIRLDFIINVTFNHKREIAGAFAGNPDDVFEEAVSFVREHYALNDIKDADIIIADAYPFDINLNFARDRGMWPLFLGSKTAVKVLLSACFQGIGHHELYPTKNPIASRIMQRLSSATFNDIKYLMPLIRNLRKMLTRKNLCFSMVSAYINQEEITKIFPHATIYPLWDTLAAELIPNVSKKEVTVAVFQCAPLYFLT